MLGRRKYPDPFYSTHYHQLPPQPERLARQSPSRFHLGRAQAHARSGTHEAMPIMAGLSALQTFEALAAIAARKTGVQAERSNIWLEKAQLVQKLQQAESLLTAQSDLIDGLRIKLGSTQQQELSPQDMQHQHFQVVQDGSLAEVQESKTAHLLAAVADYVQQTTVAPGSLRYTSEHSLAAVQQHHMVGMIKEVTQYLQKHLMCMQQTCRKLAARQG